MSQPPHPLDVGRLGLALRAVSIQPSAGHRTMLP